ncbi:glutamate--tRNA ligase [Candidatus Uhrbacteria bacterium]|jgi:nondiscriminating glutamyl-tRNA synthetase|nr:glutamate--tRNA ligase [Candidatus Uhrbacteria bacterium]
MSIKTRFPPSPTGYLHIGSLRTALYNYLLAKKLGGTFLLRVEDTDQSRLVEGAVENLLTTLKVAGINHDEGPVLNEDGSITSVGDNGPYVQSERLDIYKEHAQKLLDGGHAYYCFCSKERLDEVRKQQQIAKMQTKYDRKCVGLDQAEALKRIEAGESYVVRLQIPDGETTFADEVRGSITISNSEIDDQVLVKADGFPTYHLAVVVDDHLMGVTHVVRGEEWISSVPKHVVLYNAFNFTLPVFAHLPLILNPDKSKLSKRQGDVAVEDFLKKGYLPEALNNFVALLGFNPSGDQEVYSMQELIDAFDLKKINKSGAIFDPVKLGWMNGVYIKAMDHDELVKKTQNIFDEAGESVDSELLSKMLVVEKERLTVLNEMLERTQMYTTTPEYDDEILVWKKSDKADALKQLTDVLVVIESIDDATFSKKELIEEVVKEYISSNELSNGNVLWPMRVALSGQKNSPGPFDMAWVLGKEEAVARLTTAVEKLS